MKSKDTELENFERYKTAYFYLFNQVTEVIEQLKNLQSTAEEICISDDKSNE